MTVPVHVVAGFLGAGKTTTLISIVERLTAAGERVAVVVNDFGESAIDHELVGERGLAVQEIRGACLCCTAPEGFVGAVGELLDEARPDRILVEPTGLARPADLVDTLRRAPYRDALAIGPLVVVVDPHVLAEPDRAELREQAAVADVLVVNRTDLADPDELAAVDRWLEGLWPQPLKVVRTTFGKVPLDVLSWPDDATPAEPRVEHEHEHEHDHDDHGHVARSRSWPAERVFVRRRLLEALEGLGGGAAGRLARLKGLVRTEEGVELVEIAGGRLHTRPTGHRRDSRIDLILEREGADLERAEALLDAALRRPDEVAGGVEVEIAWPDGRRRVFDRADLVALPDGVADVSELVPGRSGAAARVRSLLAEAGVEEGLDAVVVAVDGYVTPPVPVEALASGVLLHSLADAPLPAGKGGPFRLLIPGDAGPGGPCANVKGVVRIALRPRA